MHPRHQVDKAYRVTVTGYSPERLENLKLPVTLDGYTIQPPGVQVLHRTSDDKAVLLVTIHEGRNRQIRRMCEEFGLDVKLLKREMIGELRLKHLKPGQIRFLEDEEIEYLKKSCRINEGE